MLLALGAFEMLMFGVLKIRLLLRKATKKIEATDCLSVKHCPPLTNLSFQTWLPSFLLSFLRSRIAFNSQCLPVGPRNVLARTAKIQLL